MKALWFNNNNFYSWQGLLHTSLALMVVLGSSHSSPLPQGSRININSVPGFSTTLLQPSNNQQVRVPYLDYL